MDTILVGKLDYKICNCKLVKNILQNEIGIILYIERY